MTEDQWYYLNTQISALKAVALAIAKTMPNQEILKKHLSEQREAAVASMLDLPVPDSYIDNLRTEIDRLARSLWEQAPSSQP